jgi:integral membrane protein (TIGR01906 family)
MKSVDIFAWVVTILVPVALILTSVRILMTPVFVEIEYRTPNFPRDPFGFTQEDRLHWAQLARLYLLNDSDISYLAEMRFSDGSPLYNQRELGHMVDVKNVVKAALSVWYLSLAVLIGLGVWAALGGWWETYRFGLARGGWLTVILVGVVILFVLVGFGIFFVYFHEVFFNPGTWIFEFSDTLIRLFPERFWRDAFLVIGGLSLLGGLALALGFRGKVA